MECYYCHDEIKENASYWEDHDGNFFCSEEHLDDNEQCKDVHDGSDPCGGT